jgi:hypothetical protein
MMNGISLVHSYLRLRKAYFLAQNLETVRLLCSLEQPRGKLILYHNRRRPGTIRAPAFF